uniref:Uncharacterized protein n=1 Tax=Naja naja TaxID=35670 RepID=A0A8C6Y485_NAJNA
MLEGAAPASVGSIIAAAPPPASQPASSPATGIPRRPAFSWHRSRGSLASRSQQIHTPPHSVDGRGWGWGGCPPPLLLGRGRHSHPPRQRSPTSLLVREGGARYRLGCSSAAGDSTLPPVRPFPFAACLARESLSAGQPFSTLNSGGAGLLLLYFQPGPRGGLY